MSKFVGIKDTQLANLVKVGAVVKSHGNSNVGGDLVFGELLLTEIFKRENRYAIFNTAGRRFTKGKFAVALNRLNIGDFGLRASTDGSGEQINFHKAKLGGEGDVIKLRPFDDVLEENWFERIETEEYRDAIIDLISEKLVKDASVIALASKLVENSGDTFEQFDGWSEQGTKVDVVTNSWRVAIDAGLEALNGKAHQYPEKVHVIVPASKKVEVYKELVANNIIMESEFNKTGKVSYMGYNFHFDATLDTANRVVEDFGLNVVIAYEGVHELVYSSTETVYVETQLGRTTEKFFGTYFAPVVLNKDLFVTSKVTPTVVDEG